MSQDMFGICGSRLALFRPAQTGPAYFSAEKLPLVSLRRAATRPA